MGGCMEKKAKIMVVDDSPLMLRMMEQELREEFDVCVFSDGLKALEAACGEDPPDLILLDVVMPGMGGYDVCRRLKSLPETRDIPVLFLTGQDNEKEEEKGLIAGAIDYIRKPFSFSVVVPKLRNHLALKRQRELLESYSLVDSLTGIPNRRAFDQTLVVEHLRASRAGYPLSILMADIDHFKRVNDFWGHLRGDQCLKDVAAALHCQLRRPGDFMARWGGEEFACILPGVDTQGSWMVAESLRIAVEDLRLSYGANPEKSFVSISLGAVTQKGQVETGIGELMERADRALYQAKRLGRNRVVLYEEIDDDELEA